MAWTDIANTQVDPGSPVDTALMTALRDNIIETALVNQTWQDVSGSRVVNTSYQNTTPLPIMASVVYNLRAFWEVSVDNVTFVRTTGRVDGSTAEEVNIDVIVPPNHYYRLSTPTVRTLEIWAELR